MIQIQTRTVEQTAPKLSFSKRCEGSLGSSAISAGLAGNMSAMTSPRPKLWSLAVLALGGLSAFAAAQIAHVEAADHLDPPARTNPMNVPAGTDRAADIADVYAWHQGTGAAQRLVVAMSFSGPNAPVANQAIACDRDVLYTIHIDNNGDGVGEHNIEARFGRDSNMNCLVQFSNIPGVTGTIVAATEHTLTRGPVKVFAGLRDDAFFFDLEGFRTTLSTGTVAMRSDRDFFAGLNTSVIVVEMPASAALATPVADIRVWGTTQRHAP